MLRAMKKNLGAVIVGVILGAIVGLAMPLIAQTVPGGPPGAGAPATVPEWVVRYAGNQEQASRACQMQLAQEQAKLDTMQKELADAKSALAAAKPAEKPAAEKK